MKTKRFLTRAFALGLASAMLLCGCNSSKGNESGAGDGGAAADPSKYTIPATGSVYAEGIMLPELSQKEASINYMTNTTWEYIQNESSDASPTAIYHAMLIWKDVYGVDVEIDLVDWDSFTNHLISSVSSGEGPDVLRYFNHPNWVNSNLVAPLEDKMNLKEKGFNQEAMEKRKLNGHIYAVYCNVNNMPSSFTVYNKTKFVQSGEKTPMEYYKEGKWTMTQMAASAKKLTNAASDDYGITGTGALAPTVAVLMEDRSVKSLLDDVNFQKFFGVRVDLMRSGNARTEDKGGTNYRETFPKGKDAMFIAGISLEYPWLIEAAKKAGVTDEFGIAPLPIEDEIGETKPRGSQYTYDGFATSLHSNNQKGAIEFLRLVTLVGSNISDKLGEFGQMASCMSEEEKEVFRNIEYQDESAYWKGGTPIGKTAIAGFENCYNQHIMQAYVSNNQKSVSQICSEMSGPLNSVITEYEISVGVTE